MSNIDSLEPPVPADAGVMPTEGNWLPQSSLRAVAAAAAATAVLAGCEDEDLPPPTEDSAAHFLAQASLYVSMDQIKRVMEIGYGGWIDEQMKAPLQPMSVFEWMRSKGFERREKQFTDLCMDSGLWWRVLNADDVLRQRVVMALSEIFVVGIKGILFTWGVFEGGAYWDTLEANCFGNFRTLLEKVSLSPAMGSYLSMRGSRKEDEATGRQPDENFAREILQLFSIGLVELNENGTPKLDANGKPIETYTNDDIRSLAKVFTGWDFDGYVPSVVSAEYARKPMVFHQFKHSTKDKTFLGVTIPGDTPGDKAFQIALDTIFNHPNVGPFISRQLIQRLTSSNPSKAYVARVARVFNDNGQGVRGDMAAVIREILMDMEVRMAKVGWNATSNKGKLREPMLRFIQWARVIRLNSPNDLWEWGDLSLPERLSQSPLRAPSVFNFFRPGYVPPRTALAAKGMIGPEFQITDECSVVGFANYMHRVMRWGDMDITVHYDAWLDMAKKPVELVDRINLLFTARTLAPDTVNEIITAVSTIASTEDDAMARRVQAAMLLVICCPEYLVQR